MSPLPVTVPVTPTVQASHLVFPHAGFFFFSFFKDLSLVVVLKKAGV